MAGLARYLSVGIFLVLANILAPAPAAAGFFDTFAPRAARFETLDTRQGFSRFEAEPQRRVDRKRLAKMKAQAQKRRLARIAARQAKAAPAATQVMAYAATPETTVRKVAVPTTPQEAIQKALRDDTLRAGDIVMGVNGPQVVVEPPRKPGAAARTLPARAVAKTHPHVQNLSALTSRPMSITPVVSKARSAAPPSAPVVERWIEGQNGQMIRFVGGYY